MSDLKEWFNPLISIEDRLRIADGEISTLRAKLAEANRKLQVLELHETSTEHLRVIIDCWETSKQDIDIKIGCARMFIEYYIDAAMKEKP